MQWTQAMQWQLIWIGWKPKTKEVAACCMHTDNGNEDVSTQIIRSRQYVQLVIMMFLPLKPYRKVPGEGWQEMIRVVQNCNWQILLGSVLSNTIIKTKEKKFKLIQNAFIEIRSSWATRGHRIMTDSWKDVQINMINDFLVSGSRGTFFFFELILLMK